MKDNTNLSHDGSTEDQIKYWHDLIQESLKTANDIAQTHSDNEKDHEGLVINEAVMDAPRRKSANAALAQSVAALLHPAPPDSLAPIIQYEKDIVMLRSLVLDQRRSAIVKATARNDRLNWIKRITKQGPWNEVDDPISLKGAPALPMPVEQSDKESLAPFFAHLRSDGTHAPTTLASTGGQAGVEPYYNVDLIEFPKGVLYADGRIDLCKMVTGPRNIGDLMESLKTSTFSRHFLLGNNIIGPVGADAIARFIQAYPNRFETWYLAGNCIDGPSFTKLVDALVWSPVTSNVWLKRNPLGPTAATDIFRLIILSQSLRTLDLDQTELGDAGVSQLFKLLLKHDQPVALRHIYLNACGIGANAIEQIAKYLRSTNCSITSLYMSNNPIGASLFILADGLRHNKSLERLSIQSCGLKDPAIISLAHSLEGHDRLRVLDIGQAYATEDLGMRYNWVTDDSVPHLMSLICLSSSLQYLNISYAPITQRHHNGLLYMAATSSSLVWFQCRPLFKGEKDAASVKAGQENARLLKILKEQLHANVRAQYGGIDYAQFENEHKRFLMSPQDVRFIDSVYRNRDAWLARRGLKRLDKLWDEGDETLLKVQDGTLV